MDPQPLVAFFFNLADFPNATEDSLKATLKKKYSTLTPLCYTSDSNLLQILEEKKPEYIISIAQDWKAFPYLSSQLPANYRKRWLHYSSLDQLSENALYNSWMSTIFDFSTDALNPLVSVFTTSYKSGDKILRPLRSLKAQSFTNWEWVIFDDTDPKSEEGRQNWELLESLAKQDYRIRIYRSNANNGKIGAVKFAAAQLCAGSLLVEVDHDDDLSPDCLQVIVDAAREYPEAGFFFSDCTELKEDGTTLSYGEVWGLGYGHYYFQWYQGRWIIVERSPNINPTTVHHIVSMPNHVRAWSKKCYQEVGGHCRSLPVVDDYELILRTALTAQMVYIPRMTYLQYRNEGGNNFTTIRNAEIQKLVKHIDRFYSEKLEQRCLELVGTKEKTYYGQRCWEQDYTFVDPVLTVTASVADQLSVVISNPGPDLQQCLSLLLGQSYKGFELLVVGDASCKQYKSVFDRSGHDSRVRWWFLEKSYSDHGLTARNYILRGLLRTKLVTYVNNIGEITGRDFLAQLVKNYQKYAIPFSADTVEGNQNKYYYVAENGVLIHDSGMLKDCGYWKTKKLSLEESQNDLISRFDRYGEDITEIPEGLVSKGQAEIPEGPVSEKRSGKEQEHSDDDDQAYRSRNLPVDD
jgi:O-antigen biosynthesis protein